MTLKFCSECNSLLHPKETDEGTKFHCKKCNLIEENSSLSSNETIPRQKEKGKGFVNQENEFATYENICKKCGHNKAQIIDMGVFYSDEDSLILLKCGKCSFAERIGNKTS